MLTSIFIRMLLRRVAITGTLLAFVAVAVAAYLVCVNIMDVRLALLDRPRPTEARTMVPTRLEVTSTSDACRYYSVWDVQPVQIASGTKDAEFSRDFSFEDGCSWRSHEHLHLVSPGVWAYDYTEAPLQCDVGATPAASCTRSGLAIAAP